MAGEDLNYYYLGHLMAARAGAALGGGAGRRLQPRGRDVLRALGRSRRSGSRTRSAAAVRVGLWGVGAVHRGGHDRLRPRSCSTTAGRCATTTGSAPSRVIQGTINEFPCVLVHARRPARARDGDPVHAAGARVRRSSSRCRAGAAAARRRRRSSSCVAAIAIGTLYAINAWSLPVVAGLVALGALVRLRDAPSAARAGAHARAGRWWCCCSRVLAVLPFLLTYDTAAARLRQRERPRAVRGLGARPRRSSTASSPTWSSTAYRDPARALAPPVADGGLGARGGAVRGLAAGGRRT